MASAALKLEGGTDIPGEGGNDTEGQSVGRDYEAEAKELGWRPKEEFSGDDTRWIDAETFIKRGEDMMPLLKATNAKLKRELDTIKKDLKRATAHFEGAEKRAYDRALSDLEQKHREAVEAGDVKTAEATVKELRDLRPTETKAPEDVKQEVQEAMDSFREENPWYDKANLASASELEINARLYYDRMVDRNIEKTKEMAPADFFAMISNLTHEKYPQLKAKREKPASAVSGGTAGRQRGSSKSWDGLPDTARRQFQKFIDRGILGVKSTGDSDKDVAAAKAYYARTFDWEGYKE